MRISWVLLLCTAWCAGCTLVFDSDSVGFGQPSGDVGNDLDRDLQEDLRDDVGPKVVPGLGDLCGIETPLCVPEDDLTWPECAHGQCQRLLGSGGQCLLGSSPWGFCSRPCREDSECQGDLRDPFSASMRCVTGNGGDGFCLPGSQEPCVVDGVCPQGESCKLTQTVLAEGLNLSVACQTDTRGGVDPGQACVDDPRRSPDNIVRFCKNDFCFDDVCASFCDPASDGVDCGNANLACRSDYFDLLEHSTLRRSPPESASLCLPSNCEGPGACDGAAAVCTPGLTLRKAAVRKDGVCREDNPLSLGSAPLGSDCEVEGAPSSFTCASRFCTGFPPNYYCSTLCDSDSDCGAQQLCTIARSFDNFGRYFSRVCRYASGSQGRCDRLSDPECPIGEVCAPFVFGDVTEDGAKVSSGSIEGRCVRPVQGGVRSGNACGEQECIAPDACVRFLGEDTAQCVTVCGGSQHCENALDVCLAEAIFIGGEETVEGQELVLGICSL